MKTISVIFSEHLDVFVNFFLFLLTSDGERDDIVDAILKNNWRFE